MEDLTNFFNTPRDVYYFRCTTAVGWTLAPLLDEDYFYVVNITRKTYNNFLEFRNRTFYCTIPIFESSGVDVQGLRAYRPNRSWDVSSGYPKMNNESLYSIESELFESFAKFMQEVELFIQEAKLRQRYLRLLEKWNC